MSYAECAAQNFLNGCNCAQAVLLAQTHLVGGQTLAEIGVDDRDGSIMGNVPLILFFLFHSTLPHI